MTYLIYVPSRDTATEANLDAARETAARLSEEHQRDATILDAGGNVVETIEWAEAHWY